MTLTIDLTEDLEQRLTREAEKRGVSADRYTLELLDRHLPLDERRGELIGLLSSWINQEDPREQVETGDYLVQALDEDRPSDRKLFPPDLRGVTW